MIFSKKNQQNINTMRKKILLLFIGFITLTMSAQSPESFTYQSVVRDGSGNVIANQSIGIQINILQTSSVGTVVYGETFSKTSNDFGLVNLAIGTGTVTSGVFADIDWSAGPYFIEVAIDVTGGTSYTVMGTSQLLSVPYALYAKNSGDSRWEDSVNSGIGYTDGTVAIGTLDALPTSQFLVALNNPNDINTIRASNEHPNGLVKMNFSNDIFSQMVIGINGSASAFGGANEAYMWYFGNFDLKFATNSVERLRIKNTGNIEVKTGDVYIENLGSGVIMKSPDGNCWRMTVDNTGNPVFTSITCP